MALKVEPARVAGQLTRFLMVGAVCALIDWSLYLTMLEFGVWVHLAKAVSFVAGTTTAFLLNRRFTFGTSARRPSQPIAFALLYTCTFTVNIGINALLLYQFADVPWKHTLAWGIAQAVGTSVNFVLLRAVVFRSDGGR